MKLKDMLLKTMKHRDKHAKYSMIMQSPLLRQSGEILPFRTINDFGRWFKENPDAQVIDKEAFVLWSKLQHQMSDLEADWVVGEDIDDAQGEIPESMEAGLMDRIATEIKSLELEQLLKDYRAGKPVDLYTELRGQVNSLETELHRKNQTEQIRISIEELLAEERNQDGLVWRLPCLNRAMRPLRPGDFVIVAARPDAGKTSFLASELTYMASQLCEGRPVLWLNNEGPGRRIVGRTWQAALSASMEELEVLHQNKELNTAYANAVGGAEQLKVYDVHDLLSHEIEDLIKRENPGVVVFDMIDNIKFSGSNHLGGERTDQLLETMYQWARVLGVKHDCVIIATSQISADGEGKQWPNQSMLKDSRTGKQGAADVILMIGKTGDSDARYLSTPKNKLARSGCKDPRAEVLFDGVRSRFHENKPEPSRTTAPPTRNWNDTDADDDVPF